MSSASGPSGSGEPVGAPEVLRPEDAAARPSGRPEFTALLDTLRDGPRPARGGRSAAPRPQPRPEPRSEPRPEPRPEAHPEQLSEPIGEPVFEALSDLDSLVFEPMPPQARPAPAPMPVRPPIRAPKIPAQATPQPAELDDDEQPEVGLRQSDPRTASARRTLRALGVPPAWTRLLRPGDRFAEVLRMLERMPVDDIDPATPVVAVVGPASSVRLEAHRTALDLAIGDEPRPVVVVPAAVGTDRAAAVARALRSGPVVLAVETDGGDPSVVLDTLTTVQAGAVIALVDAELPHELTQRWLDALGQVDALVVEGATVVTDPAAVLQLGLPVIRLDGIPVDRVTWAALLCAQIVAAEAAATASLAETAPTRATATGR